MQHAMDCNEKPLSLQGVPFFANTPHFTLQLLFPSPYRLSVSLMVINGNLRGFFDIL